MAKPAPEVYMFVANRDVNVTSLKGYSFNFEKGIPQHVPKACHTEMIERGILPVAKDGTPDLEQVAALAKENDPKVRIVLAPETNEDRADGIRSALLKIADRNNAADFTSGGIPSPAAVSTALGWRVDGKEIKPIWQEIKVAMNAG